MGPLTGAAVLAALSVLSLVLADGGAPALAADALGLGLERLQTAQAQVHVEADQLEYQEQRRVVVGRGGVMIRHADRILHADEVRVDLARQEFEATGRVLLVEGPSRLEGDRLEFNYGTGLGVIFNARGFLFPATNFRGIEIRKVGAREYHIRQGAYSSCYVCLPEDDPRAWEMRAEEATLLQDEAFTAWHASVWLAKTFPAIYTPLVSVPLGPRRSGFLLPRMGHTSSDGFNLGLPFFWAISESQDATITGTYRTQRGFELDANYRYILSPFASGEWRGSYLPFDKVANERNRWEIHGTHLQLFSPTLSFKSSLNFQSDTSINRLIDRSLQERTQRVIQSNVFLTQGAETYNAMAWADVSRDLEDTQDTRLLRVPELRLHLFDRALFSLPLAVGGMGSFAYFERRNLQDSMRADFAPRLRVPWAPAPWLGLVAGAGVRETVYSVGNQGYSGLPSRSLYHAEGGAEARFLRTFEVGGRELRQLVHVVAPRIGYHYVPFVDQQRFPQFDQEDFVSPQNHLTYALDNRFIARLQDADGNPTTREVLRLGVAQSFNFRPRTRVYSNLYLQGLTPERVDNAVTTLQPVLDRSGAATEFSQAAERQFTDLVLTAQTSPHPLLFLQGTLGYNTSTASHEVTNFQARLRYPGWGYVGLSYTNVAGSGIEAYIGSLGLNLTPDLSVEVLSRLDWHRRTFLETNVLARYSTCCWDLTLRFVNREPGFGQPTENAFRFLFTLKTGRPAPGATPAPAIPGPPTPSGVPGVIPGAAGGSPSGPGAREPTGQPAR
jgi:LPS-assembly protein